MSARFHSSPPDKWVHPRPHTDPSLRYRKHGAVLPMEYDEPGFLRRLWGRR